MKNIILQSCGIGRYDDVSPYIIADNFIEMKIDLPKVNGEFYLIAQNNDKTVKKLLSKYESVKIEGLSAGEFNAEVKHYLKGVLIKSYRIEPLILIEVDGSIAATPEITELNKQISDLSCAFEKFKNEQEEAKEDRAKREKKNASLINALIRFAWSDYRNNVYLSGGSFEDFLAEFGFEFTVEEIKLFKGEQK